MITKTIIKVLREDSALQSLLGATGASDCPVFSIFEFRETVDKQINVGVEYGETQPFDCEAKTHDGRLTLYILVKDTVSEPIKNAHTIAERVYQLLDLKGTTLDATSTVYWVQKLDTDFTHYMDLHFYELSVVFRFVIQES